MRRRCSLLALRYAGHVASGWYSGTGAERILPGASWTCRAALLRRWPRSSRTRAAHRRPAPLRDPVAAHPLRGLGDRFALRSRPHAVPADRAACGGERHAPRGHRAQTGRGTVGSHVHDGRPVMTQLATGVPPPPFTLSNQDGRAISLSDFTGRHVLVWFFSRAFGSN